MKFIDILKKIINTKYVYRFDDKKIDDFNLKFNTYQHTDDWIKSGILPDNTEPDEGFKKSIGLFAGNLFDIAPYASPRGTPFLKYHNNKNYIVFRKEDKSKIESHKPFLTIFNREKFQKLKSSNEYFAHNNNKIEFKKQKQILNPIKFMEEQGYTIKFVDNLKTEKKELKKQKIKFDEETVSNS